MLLKVLQIFTEDSPTMEWEDTAAGHAILIIKQERLSNWFKNGIVAL